MNKPGCISYVVVLGSVCINSDIVFSYTIQCLTLLSQMLIRGTNYE